ncbi:MAG: Outer rane efflux protein [Burkholderia sp.]|nr:Outer rane efflux protein [Burkholderia sp.]
MRSLRSPRILSSTLALAALMSHAVASFAAPHGLREAVEAAWARQPETRALAARQEEMAARRDAASSLFPAPPSIALSQRTDRYNQNGGDRETEAEVSVPLWMPGARSTSQRLAATESVQLEINSLAFRLKIAGAVREAYWQARFAQNDRDIASRKASEAAALMQDVERRFKAGDLARTDLNQAQGAERLARANVAEAQAHALRASKVFIALTGLSQLPEADEEPAGTVTSNSIHPQLAALGIAVEVGKARLAQVSAERRDPPEVSLGMRRERPAFGDAYENSVRIGIRIPLATDARNRPRVTAANAELIEAEGRLTLERDRVQAEIDTARAELGHARSIEAFAQERYQLAADTQGLHEKAFRLGELGLPTRLHSENERFDAELALSRARLEVGRAVSRLNQASGLLP